jgi:hypothetical protein
MLPSVASSPSGVMAWTWRRMRNFISSAARSVKVKATMASFGTLSTATHHAIRRAITSVFPEPAPAMTRMRRSDARTIAF